MDKHNYGGTAAADPFDSVTAFYMQHKRLLFQEAWKYLSQLEDVEDVVCETLARLLENAEKFQPMAPAQQIRYARVIVRNLAYQLLKRSNYFTMVPFEDMDIYLPINEAVEPEVHCFWSRSTYWVGPMMPSVPDLAFSLRACACI